MKRHTEGQAWAPSLGGHGARNHSRNHSAGCNVPLGLVLPAEGTARDALGWRRAAEPDSGWVSALGLCATKQLSPAGDVRGLLRGGRTAPSDDAGGRCRTGRGGEARRGTAGALPPSAPRGLPLSGCPPARASPPCPRRPPPTAASDQGQASRRAQGVSEGSASEVRASPAPHSPRSSGCVSEFRAVA